MCSIREKYSDLLTNPQRRGGHSLLPWYIIYEQLHHTFVLLYTWITTKSAFFKIE